MSFSQDTRINQELVGLSDSRIEKALRAIVDRMDIREQNNTWTKGQRGSYVALTSASEAIAVDLDASNNFSHVMTEDTTLSAPSNVTPGQSGVIHFTQHASAAKTLAFNAFWVFGVGAESTITTTTDGTAVMTYIVDPDGTTATCSWVNKA